MARRRRMFQETTSYEVYSEYKGHVLKTDTYPNPHAFWLNVLKDRLGYNMNWGSFQYHWMQLQIKGLIIVDDLTHAVKLPELDVVEVRELSE